MHLLKIIYDRKEVPIQNTSRVFTPKTCQVEAGENRRLFLNRSQPSQILEFWQGLQNLRGNYAPPLTRGRREVKGRYTLKGKGVSVGRGHRLLLPALLPLLTGTPIENGLKIRTLARAPWNDTVRRLRSTWVRSQGVT